MHGRGLILVFVGALAIGAVGAGCGGDSGEVTASAEVDKPTFIKKAEAVCRGTNTRTQDGFEDLVKSKGGNPSTAFDGAGETALATEVILPEKQRQVDELRELTVPEADKAEFEAIVDAYQEGIDVGEDEPKTVTSAVGVFKYAAKLAEDYGLRQCRW